MEEATEQEEKPSEDAPLRRKDRDVAAGLGRVMEKVVDKVMDRMMEKVMDKMVERWKLENKERIERTVVETMNETIDKLTGEAQNSEQELGRKVEEMVDRVVMEVALIMERMMQQVEQKLKGEIRDPFTDNSSEDSVCEMPSCDANEEEEEEEEDEEDEIFEEPSLTPNQREAFLEIFHQFTQHGTEIIDFSSLKSALTDLEIFINEEAIYNILEALDTNRDREANFEDFLKLVTNTQLFFLFYKELPDHCEGSQLQTGSVDNTVFFEILSKFVQTQMLSEDTTRIIISYYYMKKKGEKLKSKRPEPRPKQVLPPPLFLGQTIYSLATYVDILEPDEEYKELPLSEEQVKAFRDVFNMFCRDKQDCIDVNCLLNMMSEVQMYLKNPLIPNEMKCTEVNWGKEVSFGDFLMIMTSTETFAEYLTPQYEECQDTVATPVVMFQAINKLVDSPILSGKTKGIISAYYRSKFIQVAQGYGGGVEIEELYSEAEEPEPPRPGASPGMAEDVPALAKAADKGGDRAGDHAAAKEGDKVAAKHGPKGQPKQRPKRAEKCQAKWAPKSAVKQPDRSAYGRKAREISLRRKQNMQKRFEAAMKNPAFHRAFKAYSWTWKEREAKQKQEASAQCSNPKET